MMKCTVFSSSGLKNDLWERIEWHWKAHPLSVGIWEPYLGTPAAFLTYTHEKEIQGHK